MNENPIPARVFLRPLGMPLPLGVSGLAIASLVQSGLDLHWVGRGQVTDAGLVLIAVPFVLQLIACVLCYLSRDGAAGAVLGVLSTTWLAIGLVHLVSKPGEKSGVLGLMLLASGGTLALSTFAVARAKPLPAALFMLAAARFAIAGVHELGAAAAWQTAGGVVGLTVTALAGYCVLAFELESQEPHPLLPTFRRGRGAASLADDGSAQLDGLPHEAGVRQTT